MFSASRRMTFRDFVLLGSSIAVLVVVLWPAQSDRQWVEVRTDDGQHQRYSVAVDDPSLVSIKLRLKKWETPPSTRTLRTARWHLELAVFYSQHLGRSAPNAFGSGSGTAQAVRPAQQFTAILPGGLRRSANKSPSGGSKADGIRPATQVEKADNSVTQVAFIDSRERDSATKSSKFWTALSTASSLRIEQEEQRIGSAHNRSTPPVILGPVVRSARPAIAYPFALFAALATILLSSRRQRVRPPIELACQVERPVDFAESETICLRIPPTWVRIRQPTEVVAWRLVYTTAVLSAFVCLVVASFM